MIDVEIRLKPGAQVPHYQTNLAAGLDVHAFLPHGPITIAPGAATLVPTGIQVKIPEGYEIQVRPRSGLALRHGITVLNAPGTIDADYDGEIGVILLNAGQSPFVVSNGDRVAQLVLARVARLQWIKDGERIPTVLDQGRDAAGFGSTGR